MANSKVKVSNHQRNDENIWNNICNDKNAWADNFKGQAFFLDGTSSFRGVLIAYLGSDSFVVKNKRNDDVSRILKLELTTSDTDCLLVNPLSANPTKWSNTLKKFGGKLPTNCLSVFGHFVKLGLQGIKCKY